MRLKAVVVNWNGGEENLVCLRSLYAQGLENSDIVFVDNGSNDGSLERVLDDFPTLRVIRNEHNLGFATASNQGADFALRDGAEVVLFINNDCELPEESLAWLMRVMEDNPMVGICGPRILYKDKRDRIWSAGGELTWRQNLSTLLGHGELDAPHWQGRFGVDYVPGCVMLVRREVVERVGLFDDSYFAYMEDIDLCVRARRAGFDVLVEGKAGAYHTSAGSTGGGYNPRRKYMMGVNSVWFLKRHARPTEWMRFFVYDVATLPFLWLAGVMRGQGRGVAGKALGILDGLRGKRVTGERIQPGSGWLW